MRDIIPAFLEDALEWIPHGLLWRWNCFRTFRSRSSHKSSTGLSSGLWGGIVIFSNTLSDCFFPKYPLHNFELCFGLLSCWKENSLPINFSPEGLAFFSKKILYRSFFIMPLIWTRFPIPWSEKQPQTITDPPPCLTVGTTHWHHLFFDRTCTKILFWPEYFKFWFVTSKYVFEVFFGPVSIG